MRIALIHFHLKTGGVTTVIREQARALQDLGWDVLLLSGRAPDTPIEAHCREIPGLAYTQDQSRPVSAKATADAILEAMHKRWSCAADIVHVHNPTLAKNRNLQGILKQLQQTGMTLLCQIHDFAEDGRPTAFFEESYVADCHYAVINGRDKSLLLQSGLRAQGVHLLPNPVPALPPCSRPQPPGSGQVLYPVRAIRRKNIGEAILLTLYFDPPAPLAITLPPNSPKDLDSYHNWRDFVNRHNLRVDFEAGVQSDFSELMHGCRYVLTTSMTEGFGFGYLEAWTAGKALWGRLLPDICQDFIDQGMQLEHLYERMPVPLNWIDAKAFARRWQTALDRAAVQYGCPMEQRALESSWRVVSDGDCIDFGLLDEQAQQRVIEIVLSDRKAFEQLRRINQFLKPAGPPADCRELIQHNRTIVARHYNPQGYGQRLQEVYARVLATTVRQTVDKSILIRSFLTPQAFTLLKWGQ